MLSPEIFQYLQSVAPVQNQPDAKDSTTPDPLVAIGLSPMGLPNKDVPTTAHTNVSRGTSPDMGSLSAPDTNTPSPFAGMLQQLLSQPAPQSPMYSQGVPGQAQPTQPTQSLPNPSDTANAIAQFLHQSTQTGTNQPNTGTNQPNTGTVGVQPNPAWTPGNEAQGLFNSVLAQLYSTLGINPKDMAANQAQAAADYRNYQGQVDSQKGTIQSLISQIQNTKQAQVQQRPTGTQALIGGILTALAGNQGGNVASSLEGGFLQGRDHQQQLATQSYEQTQQRNMQALTAQYQQQGLSEQQAQAAAGRELSISNERLGMAHAMEGFAQSVVTREMMMQRYIGPVGEKAIADSNRSLEHGDIAGWETQMRTADKMITEATHGSLQLIPGATPEDKEKNFQAQKANALEVMQHIQDHADAQKQIGNILKASNGQIFKGSARGAILQGMVTKYGDTLGNDANGVPYAQSINAAIQKGDAYTPSQLKALVQSQQLQDPKSLQNQKLQSTINENNARVTELKHLANAPYRQVMANGGVDKTLQRFKLESDMMASGIRTAKSESDDIVNKEFNKYLPPPDVLAQMKAKEDAAGDNSTPGPATRYMALQSVIEGYNARLKALTGAIAGVSKLGQQPTGQNVPVNPMAQTSGSIGLSTGIQVKRG